MSNANRAPGCPSPPPLPAPGAGIRASLGLEVATHHKCQCSRLTGPGTGGPHRRGGCSGYTPHSRRMETGPGHRRGCTPVRRCHPGSRLRCRTPNPGAGTPHCGRGTRSDHRAVLGRGTRMMEAHWSPQGEFAQHTQGIISPFLIWAQPLPAMSMSHSQKPLLPASGHLGQAESPV